jgi:DNA-binding NarL/FixJ family response regulator
LIAQLTTRTPGPRLDAHTLAQLTTRERQIVGLVAHGLSNTEIAAELTISHATAKTHVSRAMTKLGARDRAQLVALAYQHRVVEPPPHDQSAALDTRARSDRRRPGRCSRSSRHPD